MKHIHDKACILALNLHPADGVAYGEDGYEAIAPTWAWTPPRGHPCPGTSRLRFLQIVFQAHNARARGSGVDFWWLDWQQKLTNDSVDGLGQTFWCNHVYFNDMKNAVPTVAP